MLADHPPELPGGHTNGLEQTVIPDVPSYGYLEDVVDHQVSRKGDQDQDCRHSQKAFRIHGVRQLGIGIAPVDTDAQLACLVTHGVAAVLPDSGQGVFYIHRGSQHYIQVRAEGVHPGGNGPGFHFLGVLPRDVDVVHRHSLVIVPPANQGKGVRHIVAPLSLVRQGVGQVHLGTQFRGNAQHGKDLGVHSHLPAGFRHPAYSGHGEAPLGGVVLHKAHFTVVLFKGPAGTQADDLPDSRCLHLGMGGKGSDLVLRHLFERAVGGGAHAAELIALVGLVDGKDDGK